MGRIFDLILRLDERSETADPETADLLREAADQLMILDERVAIMTEGGNENGETD